jgi:hypothetical protein
VVAATRITRELAGPVPPVPGAGGVVRPAQPSPTGGR